MYESFRLNSIMSSAKIQITSPVVVKSRSTVCSVFKNF